MKKTLITLAALAMASVVSAATEADWTLSAGPTAGTVTYSTTLDGIFDIALGDAAITNGESFTLTVTTTLNQHGNNYGTGIIGTHDVYDGNGGANNLRVYLGNPSQQNKVIFNMNNWSYEKTPTDGNLVNPSEMPLTFGFTLTYDGKSLTYAPTADSDVIWDSATDSNIVTTFNFASLTNSTTNAEVPGHAAVFAGQNTTISITKAGTLPVPEPATATLSLLALAGLAARRRRK